MIINAIIFARINSSRLPGKVLYQIGGKTVLGHCVKKLKKIKEITNIVVATSNEKTDDPIAEWCENKAISFFRGDLENVSKRTVDCLRQYPCEAFFRINADSPFIQINLLKDGIKIMKENLSIDIVTNLMPRSYPYGIAVELIKSNTFTEHVHNFEKTENEHITQYFYKKRSLFHIKNLKQTPDFSKDRWVLDTVKDWEDIKNLYKDHPNLFDLGIKELHQIKIKQ